ncbi:MAG: PH domain-containing protein [Ectothiorhodospiraceae bacterium]|nr:PH domain-containing protein [Ectothiorhodospiraceae bacterium]
MAFSNQAVETSMLPRLESVELRPISRRFAPCRVIGRLTVLFPLLALAIVLPASQELPGMFHLTALAATATVVTGLLTLAWLEARRRAYGVREQDVIYHSGLLFHRTTVLPFIRLQHVETASNPLERAFGLVRLTCFTAGGSSGDLVIQGLERETAERLREYLLQRIASSTDAARSSA